MGIRLLVRPRNEAGGAEKPRELVLDDEEILVGRDKACHLVLSQTAVSRQHAKITRDGALTFIEDLGSAFGTQVNGKVLPKGEKRLLRNGDVVAVAQFDITFDRVADARPQSTEGRSHKTSFLAKAVVKDAMRGIGAAAESPYFRVMNGPREGQKFPIEEAQELVAGREDDVDIVLKDDLVSRRHVKFRRDWAGVHVEDLGSRNGIKVNRKKATRATLADQDEVEVGGIRLLFLDPSAVRDAPVVLPENEGPSTEEIRSPKALNSTGAARRPEAKPAPEPEPAPAEPEPPPEEPPAPEPAPDDLGMEDGGMGDGPVPDEMPPDSMGGEDGPFPTDDADEPPPRRRGMSRLLADRRKLPVLIAGILGALLALGLLAFMFAGF